MIDKQKSTANKPIWPGPRDMAAYRRMADSYMRMVQSGDATKLALHDLLRYACHDANMVVMGENTIDGLPTYEFYSPVLSKSFRISRHPAASMSGARAFLVEIDGCGTQECASVTTALRAGKLYAMAKRVVDQRRQDAENARRREILALWARFCDGARFDVNRAYTSDELAEMERDAVRGLFEYACLDSGTKYVGINGDKDGDTVYAFYNDALSRNIFLMG